MILRMTTGHFCPCWPLGTAVAHERLAWKTPIQASAGLCSLLIRPSQRSTDSRHEGLPSKDLADWQVHRVHAQALHTLLRQCFCSACYFWLRNKMKNISAASMGSVLCCCFMEFCCSLWAASLARVCAWLCARVWFTGLCNSTCL